VSGRGADAATAFLDTFLPLFVAVDVVGIAPIFFALTRGLGANERRRVLRGSVIVAAAVSLGFALVGRVVFRTLGITVADFQIAGGLILFALAALDLLAREPRPTVELGDVGAVPLGVPLIAGPAVITTTIVLVDLHGALLTTAALLANLAICWAVLAQVTVVERLIGRSGARAVSKVVSLLLAAIAVRYIRQGLAG
jgi:multiple antibiotic resistance protein